MSQLLHRVLCVFSLYITALNVTALQAAKGLMYDQAFQPGLSEHNTSGSSTSSVTVTEPLLLAKTAQPTVKLGTTLLLVPFGLIALWTIALVYFQQQVKRQSNRLNKRDGHTPFSQLPCRSCTFFKDNPYLKCAINPIDALTIKAIDCTDYTPPSLPRHKK